MQTSDIKSLLSKYCVQDLSDTTDIAITKKVTAEEMLNRCESAETDMSKFANKLEKNHSYTEDEINDLISLFNAQSKIWHRSSLSTLVLATKKYDEAKEKFNKATDEVNKNVDRIRGLRELVNERVESIVTPRLDEILARINDETNGVVAKQTKFLNEQKDELRNEFLNRAVKTLENCSNAFHKTIEKLESSAKEELLSLFIEETNALKKENAVLNDQIKKLTYQVTMLANGIHKKV